MIPITLKFSHNWKKFFFFLKQINKRLLNDSNFTVANANRLITENIDEWGDYISLIGVRRLKLETWHLVWSLSCVWLFVTPQSVALQAPLSMVFPRQEYWSGML